MPEYATTRPGPPSTTFGLLARSSRPGTHSSRSRPVEMKISARWIMATKLGLAFTKCGFSSPLAIDRTSPRSPATSVAMAAKVGNVATTRT